MLTSSRSAFALAMLFAFCARAQISLSPLSLTTTTGQATFTFGAGSCTTMVPVVWTNNSLFGTPCADMQIWLTAGECGDSPAAGDVPLPTVLSALVLTVRTGTFNVDVTQLPGFASADAGACGGAGLQISNKVCAAIPLQGGLTCISNHAEPLEIDYDTEPPAPPSIESVTVQDSALGVTVGSSSDTLEVDVQAMGPGEASFGHDTQIFVANSATGIVRGLTNGRAYQLRAFAVDMAGNASDFSPVVTGTPLHSIGFWEAYRRAGGEEQGCTSMPGGTVLVVLLRALSRRRPPRRVAR